MKKLNENLLKQVEKILRCPQTGNSLVFDEYERKMIVREKNIEYSIIDDIIDFIPKETAKNIDSYAKRAKRYEKIFENPNLFIRLFDKIIWGIKHEDYVPKVVNFIPENFQGILLDIPVGTGVLTLERYKDLPDAMIIVADYSINMLMYAKNRYIKNNITNVIYLHTNVGNLPFFDQTIDTLITMNGYHAFSDKNKAIEEIIRVLKPNGQFLGCFYTKGIRKRTDKFVQGYYTKRGWFTPPYYTSNEIIEKFSQFFKFKTIGNCKSIFYYNSQRLV